MVQEHARFEREPVPQIAPDLLANGSANEAVVRGAEFLVIIDEVLYSEQQERIEKMAETFRAERLAYGLGYGEGQISVKDRLDDPEDKLDESVLSKVEEAICSPRILVPVEADDDGCGDGRRASIIRRGSEILKRSLHRAKVFGAGLMMAVSAQIGLGEAKGASLTQTFTDTAELAKERGLNYGAHTDDHAHGPNCG